MKKTVLGLTAAVMLSGSVAIAASEMRAGCYLQDKEGEQLQGVNVDKRYEIASVSKVMTAYWATKKLGLNARYSTAVYLRKVEDGLYDAHIKGSRDPYTGREMFQFLTAELNRRGITKLRNLTYDEKFKFIDQVRSNHIAASHFTLSSPTEDLVMRQIRSVVSSISTGYPQLVARAKSVHNLNLPAAIRLNISDIHFMSSSQLDESAYDETVIYRSAPLGAALKEMNRNSNNHAANQIFESLGGADAFAKFIKADLGLEEKDIRFVNGSGDRLDLEDGKSVYNEATCRTIVKVVVAFRNELRKYDAFLQDVMAVAGQDPEGERSTVSALYNNDETGDALIAKTGTVNPSITLGGMINTEEGRIYFGYIYSAEGTAASWRDARGKIRTQVVKLFQKFGGRSTIDYKATRFVPFDGDSRLQKLESRTAETSGR